MLLVPEKYGFQFEPLDCTDHMAPFDTYCVTISSKLLVCLARTGVNTLGTVRQCFRIDAY
jgi:hypothetical protein